jgi:hypothetical protein
MRYKKLELGSSAPKPSPTIIKILLRKLSTVAWKCFYSILFYSIPFFSPFSAFILSFSFSSFILFFLPFSLYVTVFLSVPFPSLLLSFLFPFLLFFYPSFFLLFFYPFLSQYIVCSIKLSSVSTIYPLCLVLLFIFFYPLTSKQSYSYFQHFFFFCINWLGPPPS